MTLPKLMIFDMDGLIFDTERLFMECEQQIAKDYGYDMTLERYCQTLGLNGQQLKDTMLRMFGAGYPFEEISKKTRETLNAQNKNKALPMLPGIPELLAFFKEHHVPCAIASSTHERYVKEYLKNASIDNYFDTVIGGDMVKRSKPFPDIFQKALELNNVNPNDAYVLEDSENGILAANRAGIPVICIPDLKVPAPSFLEMTTYKADSALDVITYLETH